MTNGLHTIAMNIRVTKGELFENWDSHKTIFSGLYKGLGKEVRESAMGIWLHEQINGCYDFHKNCQFHLCFSKIDS